MVADSRVTGGRRFREQVLRAKAASGVESVEVGFYASAKYPTGEPVTNVVAYNEFGTENADGSTHVPERPFFRQALLSARPKVADLVRDRTDPKDLAVDTALAHDVGFLVETEIRESITNLREPPNAPSTRRRKRSSNPLVDTGFMRLSVTHKVNP